MGRVFSFFSPSRLASFLSFAKRKVAVLMIGDEGTRLIRLRGRRIVGNEPLPKIADGRPEIVARLSALADHRLVVLVDSVEQTYRREELPVASLFDHRRIIERRLDLAFPSTRLRRAVHLPDAQGKKTAKQNYLFAALPENDELLAWLEILEHLDRSIEGIGLLPLEIAARASSLAGFAHDFRITSPTVGAETADPKAKAIPKKARATSCSWLLVVGCQSTGGIRQIVIHDGALALTRLAPSPPDDLPAPDLAEQIRRDIQSTLGYLSRLGYQRGSPLNVLLLADEELGAELAAYPIAPPPVSLAVAPPEQILRLLGHGSVGDTSDESSPWSDAVFMALAAEEGLSQPLTTARMARHYRLWQAGRLARAAAAASILGLLGANGHALWNEQKQNELRDLAEAKSAELASASSARQARLEAAAVDIDLLRKLERAHTYLSPRQFDHELTLDGVAKSLTAEIRLERLSWERIVDEKARRDRRKRSLSPPGDPRPSRLSLSLDLSGLTNLSEAISMTKKVAADLETHLPGRVSRIERHAADILPRQSMSGDLDRRSLEAVEKSGMSAEIIVGPGE